MDLIVAFTLLVLAVFLGVELISKVSPTLHTPLMSGSNAISGITLIGATTALSAPDQRTFTVTLSFIAVVLATINVVGGFLVTHRMLHMFSPKQSLKRRRPRNSKHDSRNLTQKEHTDTTPKQKEHTDTSRNNP